MFNEFAFCKHFSNARLFCRMWTCSVDKISVLQFENSPGVLSFYGGNTTSRFTCTASFAPGWRKFRPQKKYFLRKQPSMFWIFVLNKIEYHTSIDRSNNSNHPQWFESYHMIVEFHSNTLAASEQYILNAYLLFISRKKIYSRKSRTQEVELLFERQ